MAGIAGSAEGAIVSLQKGDAAVFIKSAPDSARVIVDGRIMDGLTPITAQGLPAGRHDIRVRKGDLAATVIVTLSARQLKKLRLTLKPQKTALKVLTNPSEAEVYEDAQPTRSKWYDQLTPAVFDGFDRDSIRLTLFKPGFMDTTIRVLLAANKENTVSVDLTGADPEYQKLQRRFLKQRGQRRLGFRLSLASAVLAACGTAFVFLAQKDYRDAESAKERLDKAVIRTGAEFDATAGENKDKNASGNLKSTLGAGFLGVAAAGFGAGLCLYF
jgi:hypothetical protein